MPSKPAAPSLAVARLLRERREAMGLTLRKVADLSAETGNPIPHSTLARIEGGKLDPGVRRLQQLLRVYGLSAQAAGDLLDIEAVSAPVPFERDPVKLRDLAVTAWRAGRVSEALGAFLEFRERAAKSDAPKALRHEASLSFAVAAGSLGKHHLARQILDELLLDDPAKNILISILVQQSVVWRSLGSTEAALAFLDRAAVHIGPGVHRGIGWIEHQRGLVHVDGKNFERAAKHLEAAVRAHRRASSPRDEAGARLSFCRLAYDRGDGPAAVAAADRAAKFAKTHGFERLVLFAHLEKSRALQLVGKWDESRETLKSILADSLVGGDNVIRFHAHYYLWKAEIAGGDAARAEIELREAAYFVKFVDSTSPEMREVRKHLAPAAKKISR